MKKILFGSTAVLAMAAVASPAAAQTNETHYAGVDAPLVGDYELTNPGFFGTILGEAGVIFDFGTRYTAEASAPADSETATPVVTVEFSLSGSVNPDCSFYAGNDAGARDIDFGVIGVRTGDNENVVNAFSMVGDATAEIETLTAGCNFNNRVTIEKDTARGLVNTSAGSFDTDQFQNNIPYSVTANWTGVPRGARAAGTAQELEVSTTDRRGVELQGAWRSDMQIEIVAPAIPGRGLVAGDYEGTVTLTLETI